MFYNKYNNKVSHHLVLSLICFFTFSNVSFANTPKDCKHLIPQIESWVADGKLAVVQVAFNKTGVDKGNFSLADGHLSSYDPKKLPEVEGLLKRNQKGVFYYFHRGVYF